MRKTVLVTGSSRGIGASIIKKFAMNNFDVIINYLNSENEALSLKNEIITKYNVRCETIKCDISKETDVINMAGGLKNNAYTKNINLSNSKNLFIDFQSISSFIENNKTGIIYDYLKYRDKVYCIDYNNNLSEKNKTYINNHFPSIKFINKFSII